MSRAAVCHPERLHLAKGLCQQCYNVRYNAQNKSKLNETSRKWYKENRERQRWTELKRRYGITKDEYEEMFRNQNGCCSICRIETNEFLCVDHNHETGHVRGLLCKVCNLVLGLIEEFRINEENIKTYREKG